MSDHVEEGKLVWSNGEKVDYQNIDPCDICNKNSERMDFVIMAPWDEKWSFSNFYNNRKYGILFFKIKIKLLPQGNFKFLKFKILPFLSLYNILIHHICFHKSIS